MDLPIAEMHRVTVADTMLPAIVFTDRSLAVMEASIWTSVACTSVLVDITRFEFRSPFALTLSPAKTRRELEHNG
tara:strand:- start:192 stop:416 length:225 start_codon:yes stop_codon:yes gene_type:complete